MKLQSFETGHSNQNLNLYKFCFGIYLLLFATDV